MKLTFLGYLTKESPPIPKKGKNMVTFKCVLTMFSHESSFDTDVQGRRGWMRVKP